MPYLVLSSLSIFLNTKTNVATNINYFSSLFNFSSISILIADSVSLIFSSGLKEFNASTKQKIAEILKTCTCFVIFIFF